MIHHQTIGNGAPLVLIHGFGFCGKIFTPLIEKYQHTYAITTIDLPGHGKSINLAGLDNWAEEIAKVIPSNAIVLGWSIGGLVAIKIARMLNVQKLILCASTPQFIIDDSWEFGIEQSNFHSFNDTITHNISKGLVRFISLQSSNKQTLKTLKNIVTRNLPTTLGLANALDILLTTHLQNELLALKNIEVFLGEKDTIVPISIANWYKKNNINTHIMSDGHMPFLHPDFKI